MIEEVLEYFVHLGSRVRLRYSSKRWRTPDGPYVQRVTLGAAQA
jgi:hypothetical protein